MLNEFAYPRPEYPRPERQRGFIEGYDWLNLNGPWQFRFDLHRTGLDQKWHVPDDAEWREQILVPFCWESLAAWGEGDAAGNETYYSTRPFINPLEVTAENHRAAARYEVGWYRRWVTIPNNQAWHGKRVILTIGAADFFTDAWCNGQSLGRHEGGYTPFEFDLTDSLTTQPDGTRRGLLVLRVEDPMDNHEQPVGKQWHWYTTTSGIWQTVFVEPRHASHIENFRIFTDIDARTARFSVDVCHCEGCELVAQVTFPDGRKDEFKFKVKDQLAEGTVKIDPLRLWNPNDPHLYPLVLQLRQAGKVVDSIHSYFGMRKIDFAPSSENGGAPVALRLNGVPRYLRGALHQSYYPDGVYTAGEAATLKNDILYAKKVGFNFLRLHIKIDDPLLLHYADKYGMLIMADFPNFGEGGDTPLGRERFETMMRKGMQRDFNHPSIFAWCIFNETWGFGGQSQFKDLIYPMNPKQRQAQQKTLRAMTGQQVTSASPGAIAQSTAASQQDASSREKLKNLSSHVWVQEMWELAKKIDPTRLVEDMSVCHWDHLEYFAHTDTDINSWHFYINDYTKAREHIQKIVASTFVGSTFNYVAGYQHKGAPLINSEYGGIGALDGDVDVSWSFKFLTNELRRHPQISAYIYTELHDVEWEHNGFLNYDRTPKDFGYDPTIINESDVLPMDAPPAARVKPGERIRVHVDSSHYSSTPQKDITLQWRLCGMDTRGRYLQDLARGAVPIPFPHRTVAPAHDIDLVMPNFPARATLSVEAIKPDGTVIARNFVHYYVANGYPPTREEFPQTLVVRGTPADWAASEWTGGTIDRELERAQDACYGQGHGYFEWLLPLGGADLAKARRLRVLVEASSHRTDAPQTDDDVFPTTLEMHLNGVQICETTLRNHPHDARGVLSYLRGGKGAYGYLVHAFAEGPLLRRIVSSHAGNQLRLRCGVPKKAIAQGGLTIYGAECGRYPVAPTVIIEW
jgi:hypothetical protein